MAVAAEASGSDAALDSPFRQRWTWRPRVRVTALGWLISLVLRLLDTTLRVRWADDGDLLGRRARGERFGVHVIRGSSTRGALGRVQAVLVANVAAVTAMLGGTA